MYISADIRQFSHQLLDELVAHLFKNKSRSGFNSSLFFSIFDNLMGFCVNCKYVLNSSGPSMVIKVFVSRVNEMHDYFLAAPFCMSISPLALELQTGEWEACIL